MRLEVIKTGAQSGMQKETSLHLLHEDLKIRKYITKELKTAAISKVVMKGLQKRQ